jgi:hypothetical protein
VGSPRTALSRHRGLRRGSRGLPAGSFDGVSFSSLSEALRQIYIDANIKVDLALGPMRPDPATGLSARHCAVGRIRYP